MSAPRFIDFARELKRLCRANALGACAVDITPGPNGPQLVFRKL